MAGDWIKVEIGLPDKPEVHYIAGACNLDPDAVVGKLIRVWQWFDKHTVDGNAHGVTFLLVDRLVGVTGFAEAMQFAGWLEQRDMVLNMPKFDRHTSKSAKNRALTAKRQADFRNAKVTPTALPREEKRRDSKQTILDASQATPTETESSKDSNPRGSRLPDDWQLSKALGDWALKERPTWTPEHVRLEAEKFADYWHGRPGAAGRKSDWAATWRNWIRNANGTPAMPASATPRLAAI